MLIEIEKFKLNINVSELSNEAITNMMIELAAELGSRRKTEPKALPTPEVESIKIPKKISGRGHTISDASIEFIKKNYGRKKDGKMNAIAIAKKLKIHKSAVYKYVKKFGLNINSKEKKSEKKEAKAEHE